MVPKKFKNRIQISFSSFFGKLKSPRRLKTLNSMNYVDIKTTVSPEENRFVKFWSFEYDRK